MIFVKSPLLPLALYIRTHSHAPIHINWIAVDAKGWLHTDSKWRFKFKARAVFQRTRARAREWASVLMPKLLIHDNTLTGTRKSVRSFSMHIFSFWTTVFNVGFLFLLSVFTLFSFTNAEDFLMDTREGEDLTLKCRFSEQPSTGEFSYYWARVSGTKYENVAIGSIPLNSNYR